MVNAENLPPPPAAPPRCTQIMAGSSLRTDGGDDGAAGWCSHPAYISRSPKEFWEMKAICTKSFTSSSRCSSSSEAPGKKKHALFSFIHALSVSEISHKLLDGTR